MKVCVAAVATLVGVAHAQVFIHLGPLSQAGGVSADGNVVTGVKNGTVFRWTESGGMTMLSGGQLARISEDGNTIAWQGSSGIQRWTQAGGTTLISNAYPSAFGLSGDGSTIVYNNQKWSSATGFSTLQPPTGIGAGNVHAWAVNYDGSVVAGSYVPGTSHPTRWDANGVGTSLGAIPGYPIDGVANTISSDGQKILGFGRGPNGFDAFRWTPQLGMHALQVAPLGYTGVSPLDVTPDGELLVGTNLGNAFLWRAGAGPMYVKDVLEGEFGMNLNGYTLEFATGISDDGRTIVGFGTDSIVGGSFGWVVHLDRSIPSPGGAPILVLVGLWSARRKR